MTEGRLGHTPCFPLVRKNLLLPRRPMGPLESPQCLQEQGTLWPSPLEKFLPSVLKQSHEQRGWVQEKGQPEWANGCACNVVVLKFELCRVNKNARPPWNQDAKPQWTVGRKKLLLGHLYVKAPNQDLSQDQSGREATLLGGKDSLSRISQGRTAMGGDITCLPTPGFLDTFN